MTESNAVSTETDNLGSDEPSFWALERPKGGLVVTLVLFAVVALFIAFKSTSITESLRIVSLLSLPLLFAAIAAQVVSFLGSGLLIKDTARLLGASIPLPTATLFFIAGSSMGIVAGGTVAFAATMYYFMRQHGQKPDSALATGLIPDLANLLSITLLSCLGIAYLFAQGKLSQDLISLLVVCFAILAVFFLVIVWFISHPKLLKAFLTLLVHKVVRIFKKNVSEALIERKIGRLMDIFERFGKGWKKLVRGEIVNIAGDLITLYLLFLATGMPVSIGVLIAGYGVPILIGKIIPGGIGIIEGLMIGIYALFGINTEIAFVVVLAYRLVSFWIPFGLGFLSLAFLRRRGESRVAMSNEG